MPGTARSLSFTAFKAMAALAALGAGIVLAGSTASAGAAVKVVVLKEHGVGTSAAAQPYLDQFIGLAAKTNGWDPSSSGKYFTDRAGADAYVKSDSPHYGILSLPAFLALRGAYKLDVVGEAKTNSGGEQYFIVSVNQGALGDCKGKRLATDHAGTPDDQKFIDKVVSGGAFSMGDFTVVATRRFGEAGRKVLNGDADCALIHEAQLDDLSKQPGGAGAKKVWSSAKLPGMPVVAFPSAPAGERTAFQGSLAGICSGGGQSICSAVGVSSVASASNATYQAVVAAYP